MKLLVAAIALTIASPAFAQAAGPHAGHHSALAAPAAPAQPDQAPAKKDCCDEQRKAECCKDMKDKGCCADKAKAGVQSHSGHAGH